MIVIDASPAVHHKAGLGRYAEDLMGALHTQMPAENITAFYHDAANAKPSRLVRSLPQLATAQTPYPWRLRALLAQVLNMGQDELLAGQEPQTIFHATEHLLPRFKKHKTVFTLHDLIFKFFPQFHLPRNRIFLNVAMPLFLRRADKIICVSEHTKRDAVRVYGVPEEKMSVIYEGIHPRFKRVNDINILQRAKAQYRLPDKFILAVGTIEPRKNLITLFEAYKHLISEKKFDDLQLVVVGKQGWLFEETLRAVHERGLTGRVKFTGFVSDDDLPAVYSLAKAFCFPSVYEGFGFPPLEAMACGVPTLCSNASSLPEMVGDAALQLPPLQAAAWHAALLRVLTQPAEAQDWARRGPIHTQTFTWARAAAQTKQVYDLVAPSLASQRK